MVFNVSRNDIINDIMVIDTQFFWDSRWFFMETYNQRDFEVYWITANFVQDNYSKSAKGVFRGFHFQKDHTQAKLVRVNLWSVLDFMVDIRKESPTYGKYVIEFLSSDNRKQIFIPKWFAHWFLTLEDDTEFYYKCDDYYDPQSEAGIIYSDPDLNIDRNLILKEYNIEKMILSSKDEKHLTLKQFYSHNPF